jgi:hypothetical protein
MLSQRFATKVIHASYFFYRHDFLEVRRCAIATIYAAFKSMIRRNLNKPSTKRISTGVLDSLMTIGQDLEAAYADDDDEELPASREAIDMVIQNSNLMVVVDNLVEQFSKETDETTKILIHSVVDLIVK